MRSANGTAEGGAELESQQDNTTLQNQNFFLPASSSPGLGPINFNLRQSANVRGASAHADAMFSASTTLDPATGALVVDFGGTLNANAAYGAPTSATYALSAAFASANFSSSFTVNGNYDYSITLSPPSASGTGEDSGSASIDFTGTSGLHVSASAANGTGPQLSGPLSGTLAGGTFTIQEFASTGFGDFSGAKPTTGASGSGSASFGFTLTLTPSAPEVHWVNASGGTFATASNWNPQHAPGAGDGAVFDTPGTYTVTLDQNIANAKVRANGSGVNATIDVAGNHYSISNLTVGGKPNDNVHLSFVDSGGIVVAARGLRASTPPPITLSIPGNLNVLGGGEMDIGGPTSSGTVNVDGGGILAASGADAQWTAQELFLGTSGGAIFNVSNKANVTTNFANVGVGAAGNATATVSGANWDAARLVVGGQGTGTLNALHNSFMSVGNLEVAGDPASSGTITVDSAGDANKPSFFDLPDASSSAVIGNRGPGHLVVQNKGLFVVNSGALTFGSSGGGSGDATVTGSGSLLSAETLIVGGLGTGSVTASQGGLLAASSHGVGKAVIGSHGTVAVTTGGQFLAHTSLQVDGRLQIDSASETDVGDDTLVPAHAPGRLFVAPGGTLLGAGTISVNRVVLLGGTNTFGGTLKPGHSPGTLTIDGDLEQDPGSTIKIEIAGSQPGQFDVLNVTGNATYAGDLLLSFQDGFAPHQGDTFAFLNTAGSVTGSFTNVRLHDVASGFQFDLEPQSGGAVALVALNDAISTRIPGDANDDGKVDFADLLILAQNFNQDGTYSTGDFNLDGAVDFTDLLTLAQNFGQIAPPESAAQFVTVPEPTTLAGLVLVLCLSRRRTP